MTAEAEEGGGPGLSLLADLLNAVPLQAELRRELGSAIDEAGEVRDSASPTLGELRYVIRELATSTRRALGAIIAKKSDALATSQPVYRGERFLLQVIAKQKHRVKGTVRDVSGSGQTLYIEPREVEAANTKLRQLAKKEEALTYKVRKELSARVGAPGTAEGLLRLQAAVQTIDLAAARARYAARLGATPVRFGENAAVNGVELRQLRHPLLVWRDNGQTPNASAVVPMDFEVPDFVRAVVVTGPNTGGKTVSLKTLGISALMAKAGLWLLCEGFQGDADGEVELRPLANAQCPMPNAQCPMPSARCLMPDARCPMPNAGCPMSSAQCPMPIAQCPVPNDRPMPTVPNAYRPVPNPHCSMPTVPIAQCAGGGAVVRPRDGRHRRRAKYRAVALDLLRARGAHEGHHGGGHARLVCHRGLKPRTSRPQAGLLLLLLTLALDRLILLDEVGAGTDPTEGAALGMSVLRRLAGSASLTMATTHHGRLKTLKTSDPRFENACVEFDDVSLRPTYRLLWGVPGRSNALAIASRLGMPSDVIDGARELLGDQDADEHDVLVELQEQQVTPNAQCPMANIQCPLPTAQCPMPNAQCSMPLARRPMPSVQCTMPQSPDAQCPFNYPIPIAPMPNTRCPMPNARGPRPMPNAQCPMPNARSPMQCPMPNAQCPMPDIQCPMPDAQRPMFQCLHARCPNAPGGAAPPQRGAARRARRRAASIDDAG